MMNLNPDKLYDWEIELADGRVIRRSDNVKVQGTDAHINQQNPPVQSVRISLIPLQSGLLRYDAYVPWDGTPICYWHNAFDGDMRIDVVFYLGCKLNGVSVFNEISVVNKTCKQKIQETTQ